MESDKLQTVFVVGIAIVVLAAAVVLNLDVTGKAVAENPYKCINAWPQRVIQGNSMGDFFYNCPGERPYCDEKAAAAGAPRCCAYKQEYMGAGLYSGCESALVDVQNKAA